jgi:hypothetical protein
MNGDVYRFVYNNVPRGNEPEHSSVPPAPNGSNPKSFKALTQKSEKTENVGPAKMNGDVYRFVYNNVPRGNEPDHSSVPPAPNGSNPKSFKALTQ